MNNVIHANNNDILPTYSDDFFDAIVTDPDYKKSVIDLREWRRICKGNILAFCDPIRRYFDPDEIHHWVKPISTKNTSRRMSNFVEEILVIRQGKTFNSDGQWANRCGVWFDVVEGKLLHPHQKPLALICRLIEVYTNPGDVILDPFCGSGTVLVAAKMLGRQYIGMDVDSECVRISNERLEKIA
jgi:DNA modification methylase